jgi:hypothetical protein
VEVNTSRPAVTPARVFFAIVGLAAFGYFVFPGPAMREAAREKEQIERQKAKEAAEAEYRRIYEQNEQAILSADRQTIERLVKECRNRIEEKLAGPFAVYFGNYTPSKLRELGDVGLVFGKPLGRPSVALDDYGFDPVAWNTDRITDKELRARSISFTVESAQDGFSIRQYAAIYTCGLNGLAMSEPRQEQKYFTD